MDCPIKKAKIEVKIVEKMTVIMKETEQYLLSVKEMSTHGTNLVKYAYIVFRSKEGASRLIKAYKVSRYDLFCFRYGCDSCTDKRKYREKMFQERFKGDNNNLIMIIFDE